METIQDNRKKNNSSKLRDIYDKVRKIKNIEIAVAVIILAIILIIYAGINSSSRNNQTNDNINTVCNNSKDNMEENLESILSQISGTGNVNVMITYKGKVEYVTANTTNTSTNVSADDNRTSSSTTTTTSPVIVNNNGTSGPVIIKEIEPEIKGVIVVAEGADNLKVRLELMRAVMVALNIGAENIEIFAMK